ncbi:MAG: 50S ribosomal protein L22 [Candidatus Xiphinematobacter sp.]|nr:MAG: 50S ribosomal protein L22 [Candidatus Xiphinematobacter sp.]QQY08660.1 MAG: 50S ribosomal protein L22 [Candidatus Xiphinematobacter sp.]QQY09396.1 MAG: 50S ribosomal protein L22 [Candidatus Xiphinematobacter sp.]QQY10146.1 MAG: 50S ribosomal protein L22 [Candidatus Xiphinematobacter sp.]QQY10881.1 MAG: 50S ribosomal protein L22 [Candidatus Xiphinematobacter sp.]
MQVRAVYKYARVSAFKARKVARSVCGLSALEAIDILRLGALSKKAAPLILRTLKSAIANAESNSGNARTNLLVIKEATVGEGPTFKRFRPKARGSAGPIRKRTSHITIVLTDAIKPERDEQGKNSGSIAEKLPEGNRSTSAPKDERRV